ncbi:hypothetical protein [Kitasatospora sp. GP82]|uniref:hypothetical protein n=1 Tax=Kitasatospora sp. GP82 TaxID=3035089 RepID=UPI002472F78C|nr:hypothetical protein [Kitasatospora sp. GP82]
MLKKFATRAVCSAVLMAAPLVAAQPAVADGTNGPKTPQEAAVCSALLGRLGLTPSSVAALCAVQGNAG